MKKIKKMFAPMLLISILLIASMAVCAANKTVSITSGEATKTTVSVKGSTEALAVVVQVRDKDNNILAMETFGTTSGAFDAKITSGLSLTEGTTYTVYIADYEGGDWTTVDVTVPKSAAEKEVKPVEVVSQPKADATKADTTKADSAKTGDNMPIMAILFLLVATAGMGTYMTISYKKEK